MADIHDDGMEPDFRPVFDAIHAMGAEKSMRRNRPYSGQPHTDEGERGRQEVFGVTMRDLRDCLLRAFFLSAHHIKPDLYEEANLGEYGRLSQNDLYGWNLDDLDPYAIVQNFGCEVERAMGIYPNVPGLTIEEGDKP